MKNIEYCSRSQIVPGSLIDRRDDKGGDYDIIFVVSHYLNLGESATYGISSVSTIGYFDIWNNDIVIL